MRSFSFSGTQTLGERSESVGSSLCFLPPFNLHHSFSRVVLPNLPHTQTHTLTPKNDSVACHLENSSVCLFFFSDVFLSRTNPCVNLNYFQFHFSPNPTVQLSRHTCFLNVQMGVVRIITLSTPCCLAFKVSLLTPWSNCEHGLTLPIFSTVTKVRQLEKMQCQDMLSVPFLDNSKSYLPRFFLYTCLYICGKSSLTMENIFFLEFISGILKWYSREIVCTYYESRPTYW